MKVSFQGIGEQIATFEAAEGVQPGKPVKLSANGTVALCAAGDTPCGVAVNVRGGFAGVQLSGFAELPYTGTLNLGRQSIVADANGAVKAATSGGVPVLVVYAESVGKVAGVIF